MEPPPVAAQYVSQNSSRKRVFTGGSSSVMDSEVTEIPPPPVFQTRKMSKQKQVIVYEVIDIDSDEESVDVIVLDDKVETRNKGKAVKLNTDGSGTYEPKDSPMSSASGSHDVINLDCYDDHYGDLDDSLMDIEDYALLQAYFDSANIPAGVEAPVPWLSDPTFRKNKTVNESNSSYGNPASVSSSSLQNVMNVLGHSSDMDISSSGLPQQSANSNNSAALQDIPSAHYLSLDSLLSTSSELGQYYQANNNPVASAGGDLSLWPHSTLAPIQEQIGASSLFYSGSPVQKDAFNFPPGVELESYMPWWNRTSKPGTSSTFVNYATHPSFYDPFDAVHIPPEESADTSPSQDCARSKISVDDDEISRKFKSFKQFDTVEDPSDHHYASKSTSMKQPSKNWVKRIQEEWKMLENDLPDTIFVRVYESRMDILRAVIIGAEGTPYHDGLFFFDVFFPGGYPNVPPLVYYHSGGLRLNPNLYACGKVCLSLLNTWSGDKNEKWIPSVSTMLQVLVSIQALILNEKPYFNEPGWACMSGTPNGEIESQKYNENTFIFSLKTMVYTMRRPPKHFEDFVVGHFYMHAHDILNACKTYMDGAQVGCLVKGGVPKVNKSRKNHSKQFRDSLAGYVPVVVEELTKLGAKDCEKFLSQTNRGVHRVGSIPTAAI